MYKTGDLVTAIVETIMSFGIFVRVNDPNSTRAYIRQRELALDLDVEPGEVVQEGDQIEAYVVALGGEGKHLELSRRRTLQDPWPQFARYHKPGDVISGFVKSLSPYGVYVRIVSGIDGFVPLAELATWSISKPEDLLWEGDNVKAIITSINSKHRRVNLSIRAYVVQHTHTEHEVTVQDTHLPEETPQLSVLTSPNEDTPEPLNMHERNLLSPMLIIDDHHEITRSLAVWFRLRRLDIFEANSFSDAVRQVRQHKFKTILTDLNLGEDSGLRLIRYLRDIDPAPSIFVMSDPGSLIENATQIENIHVKGVFAKPLDLEEVERLLVRSTSEANTSYWRAKQQRRSAQLPELRELVLFEPRTGSPQERLRLMLENVTETLGAEAGIIFIRDAASRMIRVLESTKPLDSNAVIYNLRDSRVASVMQESKPIIENNVSLRGQARYRNLLPLLPFESCIGVPLAVNGIDHAAFFFHSQVNAFPSRRLRDARLAALLFTANLEERLIYERLQLLNPLLLNGQLATGFGHEVFNIIQGLEARLQTVLSSLDGDENSTPTDLREGIGNVLNVVLDLKSTAISFQQTLAQGHSEFAINVNEVLQQAETFLYPLAKKKKATITMHLASKLPALNGNSTALRLMFINIMLNALQQMSIKQHEHKRLEIRTDLDAKGNLQIRFIDTGPGIHHQLWERIFAPSFSMRDSVGLGLVIARNSAQLFGGTVRVEESFIPLGTVFLVELPCVIERNANE